MRKNWQLPLLLLLLAAFFMACFRIEVMQQDRGYSREAMLNPWLAAGRLLEKEGLKVRFAPDYARLPARARVLVLATPLGYLDAGEQLALMNWVKAGGHLVLALQNEGGVAGDSTDAGLGKALDVRLRRQKPDLEASRELAREPRLQPTQVAGEGTLQTHFNPWTYLQAGKLAPDWQVRDRHGSHALRFALGQGRITVLSDLDWMDNRDLGEGDHAALLWRVVDALPGDEVWLVHGSQRPSLLALIWEAASRFLIALALLVLAWLWAASRRFGPPLSVLPAERRRLSEHLEASGRYLARHGGLNVIFDASRQRLLAQVQRRHPQWRRLPSPELARQLAARARIESGAVQRLLEGDAPDHLLQLAVDIRLINRLRKAL